MNTFTNVLQSANTSIGEEHRFFSKRTVYRVDVEMDALTLGESLQIKCEAAEDLRLRWNFTFQHTTDLKHAIKSSNEMV